MRARIGLVILVTFILATAAACTSSTAGRSSPPASSAPAAHDHAGNPAPATAVKASPQQLRAEFEQLLGLHTLLAVRIMRSAVSAAPDFRQAATASLQQNTDALSRLVVSAYGSAQGERFKQLWRRHIAGLMSYASGVASDDRSAQQAARAALMAYCDAQGAWFAQASKGRIHAGQAYRIEREAYEHMFTAGATMVKGSVTPELAVGLDAAPQKLRSAFAMLLGEHLELIVEAQRATFAGSPEFNAAAAQLNVNTTTLAKAMGAIVGPRKGAEFQSAWADHVEGLMAYTAAVAANDQAGKAAAEKRLNSFAVTLAAYFSGVVRNQLDLVPLTGAITTHDRHLLDQVESYAAKDYGKAQQMEADGYQQMIGVANTLVDAIQRTVQPRMPVGGPQTGGGGTAQRP